MEKRIYLKPQIRLIELPQYLLTVLSIAKSGSKKGEDSYGKSWVSEEDELSRESYWDDWDDDE